MNRIELEQNVTSELKFQIDISGTTLSVSDIRLSIINEPIILSYRGILENNIATFNVKNAELILPADKELSVRLEVFLGDRHFFVPFSGTIIITKPIDIKAEMMENKPNVVATMENTTHRIGEDTEISVRPVKSYLETDKKVDKHIEVLDNLKKAVDDLSQKIMISEQTEELVKNIIEEITEDNPKQRLSKHIKNMVAKTKYSQNKGG